MPSSTRASGWSAKGMAKEPGTGTGRQQLWRQATEASATTRVEHRKPEGPWQLAGRRFLRHRVGLASAIILLFIVGLVIIGPIFFISEDAAFRPRSDCDQLAAKSGALVWHRRGRPRYLCPDYLWRARLASRRYAGHAGLDHAGHPFWGRCRVLWRGRRQRSSCASPT